LLFQEEFLEGRDVFREMKSLMEVLDVAQRSTFSKKVKEKQARSASFLNCTEKNVFHKSLVLGAD
jgi:hypothetical protein